MTLQLSEKAKELIPKARIVNLATWENSHSPAEIQLIQAADDTGRYLTDEDLQQLNSSEPTLINTVKFLRDSAADIVSEAREQVLAAYPNISEPGGDLYPPARAEACWRDFWHFLRCITYGIAGNTPEFTSDKGLHNMNLLYQELGVPLPAMVIGLQGIKAASLKRCDAGDAAKLAFYFDHLIAKMSQFS
ncbi:phycobilisome protein [Tychonema sp. LEGE 07199]|uniref:phycobilisome protein n=1 Tax=unclassified Tychonema TaxID=2642144 RepID=UPI0018816CE8|nr:MULTISPECIES: phycobilisome protein [unclassified Tychonema]MBE9123346.1 phycobilisome protein [Tychonema sp. LEGE 07199]MBE9135206.1 phycobilisome protein [Tychonema sp. LEGE 07196]MBE9164519.1 phycobilisome protein [Tychonema sp. LEGE 06208]